MNSLNYSYKSVNNKSKKQYNLPRKSKKQKKSSTFFNYTTISVIYLIASIFTTIYFNYYGYTNLEDISACSNVSKYCTGIDLNSINNLNPPVKTQPNGIESPINELKLKCLQPNKANLEKLKKIHITLIIFIVITVVLIVLGIFLLFQNVLHEVKNTSKFRYTNINLIIFGTIICIINLLLLLPLVNCANPNFTCQPDIRKYDYTFLGWLAAPITIVMIYILFLIIYLLEERFKLSSIMKLIVGLLFLIYTGLIIYFYVEVNKPSIVLKNESSEKGETKEVDVTCNLKFNN